MKLENNGWRRGIKVFAYCRSVQQGEEGDIKRGRRCLPPAPLALLLKGGTTLRKGHMEARAAFPSLWLGFIWTESGIVWSLTQCVWFRLCGCHLESFDNFIFALAFCKQVLWDDGNKRISSRDKPGAWHWAIGPMATHTYIGVSSGQPGLRGAWDQALISGGESCSSRSRGGGDNSCGIKRGAVRGQCQHPGCRVLTLCPQSPSFSVSTNTLWPEHRDRSCGGSSVKVCQWVITKGKRTHGNCSKAYQGVIRILRVLDLQFIKLLEHCKAKQTSTGLEIKFKGHCIQWKRILLS